MTEKKYAPSLPSCNRERKVLNWEDAKKHAYKVVAIGHILRENWEISEKIRFYMAFLPLSLAIRETIESKVQAMVSDSHLIGPQTRRV